MPSVQICVRIAGEPFATGKYWWYSRLRQLCPESVAYPSHDMSLSSLTSGLLEPDQYSIKGFGFAFFASEIRSIRIRVSSSRAMPLLNIIIDRVF
jgi:hypothetical protein